MTTITSSTAYSAYQSYASGYASATAKTTTPAASTTTGSTATTSEAATSVTLSEAARAALAERSFATIVSDTKAKLTNLLTEAGRTTPLQNGKLALDLSSLDMRELYAMSSDDSFSKDERDAAGLEMQRRFEAALSGPAAIARVTGNYTALYKTAATYLDSLGTEEKASADWKAGRDAVTEGLKQLQTAPGTLPEAGDSDPVALYLAMASAGETVSTSMPDLAANARTTLDRLYGQAKANGKTPTFNRASASGQFIDISNFSGRALSSIVLDKDGKFTAEEVRAARGALQSRSGATLLSGFQSASKSGDPTAFSQNVIAAFSSLSAEERQAVGWSDNLYQAAMQSYATTSKLMNIFNQATGSSGTPSLASLLGN